MKDLSSYYKTIESAVQAELQAYQTIVEPVLYRAMEYAITGGGKRVRPMLMLLSADTLNIPHKKIIRLAVALECIHTYSLIHDDLPCMDNDDYRRGRPTVHKVFGEAIAVLAGDALLNLASEIMLDACINNHSLISAALFISRAAGITGMVCGQAADITKNRYDETELIKMYTGKTGALIQAAIAVPYIAEQNENVPVIKELGRHIGLVFQLADDLLDYRDGSDKEKTTYVSLFGEQKTLEKIASFNTKCNKFYDALGLSQSALKEYTEQLSHRLS